MQVAGREDVVSSQSDDEVAVAGGRREDAGVLQVDPDVVERAQAHAVPWVSGRAWRENRHQERGESDRDDELSPLWHRTLPPWLGASRVGASARIYDKLSYVYDNLSLMHDKLSSRGYDGPDGDETRPRQRRALGHGAALG